MSDRASSKLDQLATKLRQSLGIIQKQDIQITSQLLGLQTDNPIQVGDDCAAIPDGDSYLLLAAEGMWHVLVETDPWFAGWCAVMVNVSDIAAMGGNAIAIVDTIWTTDTAKASPLLTGMKSASQAYNVPIVGGHTNLKSAYNALSLSILGRAKKLITSFNAQPEDLLVVAIDLSGKMHPQFPFWNAAINLAEVQGECRDEGDIIQSVDFSRYCRDRLRLQEDLKILPYLAENNLCDAGKDISMGGIVGTVLMLMEASTCGAMLDLDAIPRPQQIPLETWLLCFPSYGFLLSIRPENVDTVKEKFEQRDLAFAVVGEVKNNSEVVLKSEGRSVLFWDWQQNKLMGFS